MQYMYINNLSLKGLNCSSQGRSKEIYLGLRLDLNQRRAECEEEDCCRSYAGE